MSEEKKPGTLTGLTPEQRLKRYAILFRFNTEEDVDIETLARQWDVDPRGIAGMISGAKSSEKLCDDLTRLGYADEFPVWWWSPARDQSVKDVSKSVKDVSKTVPNVRDVSESEKSGLLTPPPRTPATIEDIPGRPLIHTQDSSPQDETPQDTPPHVEIPQSSIRTRSIFLVNRASYVVRMGSGFTSRKSLPPVRSRASGNGTICASSNSTS